MDEPDRNEEAKPSKPDGKTPANAAPDAVMDPNEKTDGKPGEAPDGNEVDPGGG